MANSDLLKKYEEDIRRELSDKGFQVDFTITAYNKETKLLEYSLLTRDCNQAVPKEAEAIVKRNLDELRRFVYLSSPNLREYHY